MPACIAPPRACQLGASLWQQCPRCFFPRLQDVLWETGVAWAQRRAAAIFRHATEVSGWTWTGVWTAARGWCVPGRGARHSLTAPALCCSPWPPGAPQACGPVLHDWQHAPAALLPPLLGPDRTARSGGTVTPAQILLSSTCTRPLWRWRCSACTPGWPNCGALGCAVVCRAMLCRAVCHAVCHAMPSCSAPCRVGPPAHHAVAGRDPLHPPAAAAVRPHPAPSLPIPPSLLQRARQRAAAQSQHHRWQGQGQRRGALDHQRNRDRPAAQVGRSGVQPAVAVALGGGWRRLLHRLAPGVLWLQLPGATFQPGRWPGRNFVSTRAHTAPSAARPHPRSTFAAWGLRSGSQLMPPPTLAGWRRRAKRSRSGWLRKGLLC